jgi:TolB protein
LGDVASRQTRLYRSAASQPAFNADGSRLAFLSWAGDSRGLAMDSVNGGSFVRLTNAPEDQLPTWSPAGDTILFFSRRTGDRRSQLFRVQAGVDFFNNQAQFVSEGEYPAWGLTGQVVFRGWGNLGAGLRLASADFAAVSDLTLIETETAPALSPDGQQVAFMERRGDDWDIYLVNSDGSDLRRLTTDPALNGLPAWSPDGRAIAFVSNREGVWSIWAMNPDGSGQQKLFLLEGSPDGKVVFEEHNSGGWLQERISWAP